MEGWPGGTHLVLESCFNKDIMAVGYKYNAKKVCHFVFRRGASLTTQGDPYLAKFISGRGNYKTRQVHQPFVVSKYFGACRKIDVNNQIRQSEIVLEEHWKTHDGWFRCVTTILGMTATDTFIACNYSFAAEYEYSGLKAKDFVSVLCYQLFRYPFPNTASFGTNVVRPGQEPSQWFELVPGRSIPNAIQANSQALFSVTNIEEVIPTVGKTHSIEAWLVVRLSYRVCVNASRCSGSTT